MELYIDSRRVDIAESPEVTLSFDASSMRSVDSARESEVVVVEVVTIRQSGEIFGGEGYLHAAERFNAQPHTARLDTEGVTLIEGSARLVGVVSEGERLSFSLQITRAEAEWATAAAETLINETPIDFSTSLTEVHFKALWEDEEQSAVQFFPVTRDDYESEASSVELGVVRRLRSIDDYHPFLNIDEMIRSVVEGAGYTIVSEMMDSESWRRLFMSGAYVSQENEVAKSKMDFCVKKGNDSSTTADYMGRVSANPYIATNSVGSIGSISTLESDSQCFSTGNYLTEEGGYLTFTPPSEISVGFEFRLCYTTGYYIESATKLKAIDTFYLGTSPVVEVEIENNFTDQRGETLYAGMQYRVVVFDYTDGANYRVTATVDGVGSQTLCDFSARSALFTMPTGVTSITSVNLLTGNETFYSMFGGEWALYMGYIDERGETEVDITVRTTPISVSPSSPMKFNTLYLEGGEAGCDFTLLATTTITPYFSAYPGYGAVVDYFDIAQQEYYHSSLIESMQHLFNLNYYSDRVGKRLFIDPVERLYDSANRWDWSSKIVEGEAVSFEDASLGVARVRTWGYQDGDGAISRSSPDFGEWSYTAESYGTNDTESTLLNPIFSPSLNEEDGSLLVGDRDDAEIVDSLEFSPRVVYYCGVDSDGLPKATFHSVAEGVSLCFEDRDSMVGLNQYYAAQIEREERSLYVTLMVKLTPFEMTSLLSPTEGMASVLSTFDLRIGGEWAECRIERIEEYSPSKEEAKIRFIIL